MDKSQLITSLGKLLSSSDQVKSSSSQTEHYSHDESYHKPMSPALLVFPKSVDEVSKVLKFCNDEKVPIVPYGAGTGLEGGAIATETGSVCLVMTDMDKIININNADFDCTVQAGVLRKNLNLYLRNTGLWFPVDPGVEASVGGMCATNASGTNALKYGTMRENVLNLEVVLPTGKIVHTRGLGRHTRKSSAGYNLTNLFVGSEGTLGIITAATLKLYAVPENITFAMVQFQSIQACVDSVVQIMQSGIPVARLEFLDDIQIQACNKYSKLNLKEVPTLFVEFHAHKSSLQDYADATAEICKSCNNDQECHFEWATDPKERERIWTARKNALYASWAFKPNCKVLVTDVCVPISAFPKVVLETKQKSMELSLTCPIIGHAGDGNFHAMILIERDNEIEAKKAVELSDQIIKTALDLGGTCTGEHGVGIGKKKYLETELGTNTIELMQAIKATIDPNNIMNPGKVL